VAGPQRPPQLSGAVVLATGDGLSRGFRGDYIGFDDGRALTVGRWVWTDEHGNQIFGEMRGEPVQTGRRSAATITGGSGRYAGVSGTYQFHWQYVVEAEDGTIQGRTIGLEGRYRFGGGSHDIRGTPQSIVVARLATLALVLGLWFWPVPKG